MTEIEFPFVTTSTYGGPWDANSYGTGFVTGMLYQHLKQQDRDTNPAAGFTAQVPRTEVHQADLIAGSLGMVMMTKPLDGPGEMVGVLFRWADDTPDTPEALPGQDGTVTP